MDTQWVHVKMNYFLLTSKGKIFKAQIIANLLNEDQEPTISGDS